MLRREFIRSSALGAVGIRESVKHIENPRGGLWTSIASYGAVADGKTNNSKRIQAAIEDASRSGGGTVYVPPGKFLTGGILLRSNITLYLEAGSELLGSTDIEDYDYHAGPPIHADANGRHLIFAQNCDNIEIAGRGTINGQGSAFWARTGRKEPLPEDLWKDVIAMDWKAATSQRPSPMLEFACCTNLRIRDVTLCNPAGWTMRSAACKSVFINGLRVRNPNYAPNADGMDISCCENVLISDCDIEAGDDAICLKSENPYGANLPTRNIVVTNCLLTTSSNGFKIGTATSGSFENISFSNSVIYNGKVPFNERVIAGIAIEVVDGGSLDGVTISDIRMQNVRTPIFIRLGHRHSAGPSSLCNVMIRGINAVGAILTSSITGMSDAKIECVSISDVTIRTEELGLVNWGTEVPELPRDYPEARMFGRLPAYGFYVRHAERIRFRNVELISNLPDGRPALMCEDVTDLTISGLESENSMPFDPLISLRNTQSVFIQSSRAPHNTRLFLRVAGSASSNVVLAGNDCGKAEKVFSCVEGARNSDVVAK